MRKILSVLGGIVLLFGWCAPAHAEFTVNSAIVEFTADGLRQQDIELTSRSQANDYIVSEIHEVIHPGQPDETRRLLDDPAQAGLLVTPDKTVLTAGGRKILRFVLLREPDSQEHIYRVAVKPVVNGVEDSNKVGVKILIGYEILVIVRPAALAPSYQAQRQGKNFIVVNNGNTNILFQNGQQCTAPGNCKIPPVLRVYPGGRGQMTLPLDIPVNYSIWDGAKTIEKRFD